MNLYGFVGNSGIGKIDILGQSFADCAKCAGDLAKTVAFAGLTSVAASAALSAITSIPLTFGADTVPALVAATLALATLDIAFERMLRAMNDALLDCPKCCSDPKNEELRELQRQIDELKAEQQRLEELRRQYPL